MLADENPEPSLNELEKQLLEQSNLLGIGPMGLGGKSTVVGVKIKGMHRLPASFYVSVAYMCWAHRRRRMVVEGDEVSFK